MNTFKSIILFCLLTFILSGGNPFYEQDEYKCASNIKLDTCFLSVTKEDGKTVGYVDSCAKGKICEEIEDVYQCVKPKTLLEEGDKCEFPEECQSGICSSKKCAVKKEGEACKYSDNCGKNLFCRSKYGESEGTCQKILKEGEECYSSEFDYLKCQTGFYCAKTGTNTKRLCTKKYSIEDGIKSDTSSVCKSGNTVTKNGDTYCATIKNVGDCKDVSSNPGLYPVDLTVSLGGASDEVILQPYGCYCESATDCEKNYKITDTSKEFTDYRDAYLEELADLVKDDDTNFNEINDDYLNDKNLLEKYVLYEYKDRIPSGDDKDCVVDFFMTVEKNSSSFLKFSLFTLLACLFFI